MLKRTSHHLALIIALLALFVAMGGPAWAAGQINGANIKKSTVTGKQIKDSSLTGADIKASSLTGADVKAGSIGSSDLAAGSVRTGSFASSAVAPTALRAETAEVLPGVLPGDFSTVGGASSAGPLSLALGHRAQATNSGSFVWADSTNADFSSTADDQFAIRAANGMLIANDAGNAATVPIGTRFRDNAIVAWGRVTANGTLDSNFNVASITRLAAGHYHVTLNSSLQSGFSLIPAVTPEVDEAGGNVPPVGAANVRLAVTNQFASGLVFDVYMYNGSFASVDNDFQFIVTGR